VHTKPYLLSNPTNALRLIEGIVDAEAEIKRRRLKYSKGKSRVMRRKLKRRRHG
jgi:hypothetical protein